jgi:hypothetical protein
MPAVITPHILWHARTHEKDCSCYKSETRDPKCEQKFPAICPWWAYQLQRHITGNFSGPAPKP